MDSDGQKSSSTRKWLLLVGGVVIFLVVFNWSERLGTDPHERTNSAEGAGSVSSPAPPEVRRLEGGGIEIRHAAFSEPTIHLTNEDKETVLFDCLTQGIAQTFGSGTEGWNRGRVHAETLQIKFACLRSLHDIPDSSDPRRDTRD